MPWDRRCHEMEDTWNGRYTNMDPIRACTEWKMQEMEHAHNEHAWTGTCIGMEHAQNRLCMEQDMYELEYTLEWNMCGIEYVLEQNMHWNEREIPWTHASYLPT